MAHESERVETINVCITENLVVKKAFRLLECLLNVVLVLSFATCVIVDFWYI